MADRTVVSQQLANGTVYADGFYGTGVANAYFFRAQQYVLETGSASQRFADTAVVQNATAFVSAPATLYFYSYSTPDRIEVYQGNTLVASTDSAVPLTDADKTFVVSDGAGGFFDDSPDLYLKNFVTSTSGGKTYAAYAGKMTWTHSPAAGTTYTVVTTKGDGSYDWRWLLEYPVDGFAIGCPPVPPKSPRPPPSPSMFVVQAIDTALAYTYDVTSSQGPSIYQGYGVVDPRTGAMGTVTGKFGILVTGASSQPVESPPG